MEIVSSLEPALFLSLLTDDTFHICLLIGMIQEPLLKYPLRAVILQELCVLMASHFHHDAFSLNFHDNNFHSFTLPKSNIPTTIYSYHPPLNGKFICKGTKDNLSQTIYF